MYCVDTGLINTFGFKVSKNLGKLMKNVVAIEILRRKSYWHNNWEIFYWKDYQQKEVDSVVKEGIKVKGLIQVTYSSSREQREIKALLKTSKELKYKKLRVIT